MKRAKTKISRISLSRRDVIVGAIAAAFPAAASVTSITRSANGRPRTERRLLYVAVPGIRDETKWGGVGVLVFDMDNSHKLVKRLPTFDTISGQQVEAVKGICANAKTHRLYVSTPKRLLCIDLLTEQPLWDRTYEGGCDRMGITPNGEYLYLPSLEGPHWNVIDAISGEPIAKLNLNSGSHNTICGLSGRFAYLAGLKSNSLAVADVATRSVVRAIGPFSNVIRPFTINRKETLCFVNVNDLLGFEIGDLKSGKMLHRVEITGFNKGPVERHGCPSHGIGLTPGEKELWVSDGANSRMHVFDATQMPPKQGGSIPLRGQPGWVTFSLDGRFAYPSTGEVIDAHTKQIVADLADEQVRPVASEKVVQIDFAGDTPIRTGDQFGLGRKL